ncbi:MAG: hypothetical protein WKF73_18915 [Nocardioidaceae bacterium]
MLRDYHQQGRLLDSGTAEQAEQSAARAWLGDTLAGRRSLLLVDTNEQAARVSAAIRAELVRLGQVDEHGVALGLQGTVAGLGDLVEARKLDWTIAGYEGNRRHAINREHYRVQADPPRRRARGRRRRRPHRRGRRPRRAPRAPACLRGGAPGAGLRVHGARRAGRHRGHHPHRRHRPDRAGRALRRECRAAATPTPPT